MIPFDTNPPMVASGVRLGTPALTTRGFADAEMAARRVADRRACWPRPTTRRSRPRVKGEVEAAVPDVPAVPSRLLAGVAHAFADDGALARALPQFEPRPGQRDMAAAVATVLDEGGVLLAEAGTGTGKTMAYLVPAILSGHRILVSTGTKNLQEQIFFKDVPVLREALGVPFTATCMKGRANYLCLHRLAEYHSRQEVKGRRLAPTTRSSCRSSSAGCRRPRPAIAPSWPICPRTWRCGTRSRPPPRPAWAATVRATASAS